MQYWRSTIAGHRKDSGLFSRGRGTRNAMGRMFAYFLV
jgi:hypothetical protein